MNGTKRKRIFDVVWSSVGLVLLWPLFVVIGLLIWIEDEGRVFFRQRRIGWHGVPFYIWKFRTMATDSEQNGSLITVGQDPRITRIGNWLRATKIDELPQLLNVWLGEMSLVGPRPEVELYVNRYSNAQRKVLELKPGITDVASLKYRRESELLSESDRPEQVYVEVIMPEKIRMNLAYAAEASVWRDFCVILLTLRLCPGGNRILQRW